MRSELRLGWFHDLTSRPLWLQELAMETKELALELLGKEGGFMRADYREFLLWGLWHLGVKDIQGFIPLHYPGNDHQARWMSDTIRYSKILALSSVYSVPTEKLAMIKTFVKFTLLFFMWGWFESFLATAAARSDLTFMKLILKMYKKVPRAAFSVIDGCYRQGGEG